MGYVMGEKGPLYVRAFQNIDLATADKILESRSLSDLPENIEFIETIFTLAIIEKKLDLGSGLGQVASFLETASLTVNGWTSLQLASVLVMRLTTGQNSYDFGMSERKSEINKAVEKQKNRESITRVTRLSGSMNLGTQLTIKAILDIDKILEEGGSYLDAFQNRIYHDCPSSNHAFLNHIEEKFNTTITNYKQLIELAKLDGQPENDVKNCYFMALEHRYYMTLEEILEKGGNYDDLLKVNPQDFNLPEKWDGMSADTDKDKMIEKAIFYHFSLGEMLNFRPRLKDVAESINAPYSKILKIYNDKF